MPTLPYHYLRALELEGRHPSDAGSWQVTVLRLEVGEGLPDFNDERASITFKDEESFPPTKRPPSGALWRNFYYRRIRSSAECDRHMLLTPGRPRLAFHLTAAWADPPGGLIPTPSASDRPIPFTHASMLTERISGQQLFRFQMLWSNWGDRGTGYMPYEYFDRYVFDCWATYGNSGLLNFFQAKKIDDEGRLRWTARDEQDHRIYAFEVRSPRGRERHAWTFIIERDGALEVEELYVRPEHRQSGHGRWLADRVAELARKKDMPLRLWVSFADCKAESEDNYPALVATARRLGVQFRASPVPWAAYFATTELPGEVFPVEPSDIPERPRAPRDAVRAFVLASSFGQGVEANPASEHVAVPAQVTATNTVNSFPAVNSPEWEVMNERRAYLIRKDLEEGLLAAERKEYDRLQEGSLAAMKLAFPSPKPDFEELARLRRELRSAQPRTG